MTPASNMAGNSAKEAREAPMDGSAETAPGEVAQLDRTFPAQPESVRALRNEVAKYARACGIAEPTVAAAALAASEAATNVIVHAYTEQSDTGAIEVVAALAGGELWVIVADTGSGLQPRRDSPGLGLGLAIIARVADGVDLVESSEGGLEVRMRFALEPEASMKETDLRLGRRGDGPRRS
jgi:anti-sigma regulatory factor (Ser/Thr protein kinase)